MWKNGYQLLERKGFEFSFTIRSKTVTIQLCRKDYISYYIITHCGLTANIYYERNPNFGKSDQFTTLINSSLNRSDHGRSAIKEDEKATKLSSINATQGKQMRSDMRVSPIVRKPLIG